eukprot:GHVS01081152.1.p1 GENE.GHVS01081152.1~~GHVS01081152.1.p1  ORF type:complete len:303 (+),score=32.73 GHVS01081152.1:214-1122(+)
MACVNRIVYGRSNGVAVLLAVAAVVLLSISHSRACQSSIDNPKGCEADAPQNGVKMTTTECIEMTQAQSSEGEYAESSEGEYGESDRSEPEDLVIEAAARALASEYVVEGPSYVSCGHLPCENGGGLTVAAVKSLEEDKGDEKKQVTRFIERYIRTFDSGRLAEKVNWFFHPEASFHLIYSISKEQETEKLKGRLTPWKEYYFDGRKKIKEVAKRYNLRSKTVVDHLLMKPANEMSMYVLVHGTMKVMSAAHSPDLKFTQEFLVTKDSASPTGHYIRYTTVTGKLREKRARKAFEPKPESEM